MVDWFEAFKPFICIAEMLLATIALLA